MVVLVNNPADLEVGRTKLTSLSTMSPNKKFITEEVIITAY